MPGTALMWGAGIALGAAAWGAWGGHWGDCNLGGGDVNINNNNNFNRNANRNVNRVQAGQGNRWQHNPQHRGNAPTRGQGGSQGTGAVNRPGAGAGAGTIAGGNRPSGDGGAGNIGGGNRPGGGA